MAVRNIIDFASKRYVLNTERHFEIIPKKKKENCENKKYCYIF